MITNTSIHQNVILDKPQGEARPLNILKNLAAAPARQPEQSPLEDLRLTMGPVHHAPAKLLKTLSASSRKAGAP